MKPDQFTALRQPLAPLHLGRAFVAGWWMKMIGTPLFICSFFILYFELLQHPVFPVTVLPQTALDQAIPMQFWAWVPYLSLWFYVSLAPAFMPNARSLIYYGWAIFALCSVGLLCFLFFPTVVPVMDKPLEAQLSWLHGLDAGGNACPSMHVAAALYTALWLDMMLRSAQRGGLWRAGNALWCAAIIYSTLATKQHLLLDVVCGAVLGAAFALPAVRYVRPVWQHYWPYSPR